MHLVRAIAVTAAIMAAAPAAMAANAPDQPAAVQLVRGGGGFHGGGFHGGGIHSGGLHGGGFRGRYAMHGGWRYRPGPYVLPYAYTCPYPAYYYPYCTFPQG